MIKNSKDVRKDKNKGNRSRSRSLSPQRSKGKLDPKLSKKNIPKSSRDQGKVKGVQNPSLARSLSKKSLKKSKSDKKLKKNSSQPRIGSSISKKNLLSKKGSLPPKDLRSSLPIKAPQVVKDNRANKPEKAKTKQSQKHQPVNSGVKNEQKQMGLLFVKPQYDKILFKGLEITDPVFDKYLQMINNDNDATYVMNALPELKNYKKEDQTEGRDFVSGRISRLSGIFLNLSVDKIITPLKKVPNYYTGQCGKNLSLARIMLQTKFKVEVDLGVLQYSLDGDKLTIFRIYVSKIYRRMNYVGFVYLQAFRALIQKHPGADRWSMFILERNVAVHKFFKYLGFHIEKIATESKNKTVDYFQEFNIKKKQLQTVLSSMIK